MPSFIKNKIRQFQYYDKITKMSNILRRYFVMNAFDGVLTIFGVLMGAYIAGLTGTAEVLRIGVGACIAVGISGVWGAFFTEAAERKKELKSLEKSLHRKLSGTDIEEAYGYATFFAAVVDGASPLLAVVALIPFMFYPAETAYFVSFGFSLLLFFILGTFLGKISKENILVSGMKFLAAGILCILFISLIGNIG